MAKSKTSTGICLCSSRRITHRSSGWELSKKLWRCSH